MSWIIFIMGFVIGFLFGRIYGWMKYHYPEFQEEIRLRTSRKRAERAGYEAQEEFYRRQIDDSINERVGV